MQTDYMKCDRCEGIHEKGEIVCPCDCHEVKPHPDLMWRNPQFRTYCQDCTLENRL